MKIVVMKRKLNEQDWTPISKAISIKDENEVDEILRKHRRLKCLTERTWAVGFEIIGEEDGEE